MQLKNTVNVGRGFERELRVTDISVSRLHSSIYKDKDKVFIEDQYSKFGTLLRVQNPINLKIKEK